MYTNLPLSLLVFQPSHTALSIVQLLRDVVSVPVDRQVFPIYTAVETMNGTVQPVGGVFFALATALTNDLNFR